MYPVIYFKANIMVQEIIWHKQLSYFFRSRYFSFTHLIKEDHEKLFSYKLIKITALRKKIKYLQNLTCFSKSGNYINVRIFPAPLPMVQTVSVFSVQLFTFHFSNPTHWLKGAICISWIINIFHFCVTHTCSLLQKNLCELHKSDFFYYF